MVCRSGCNSSVSFSDMICVKGVNAISTCGDGVPSEKGGSGCYAISLKTKNTNTVRLTQYTNDSDALAATVRIGAAGSNLIREEPDVGVYAPDLVPADSSVEIVSSKSGLESRQVSFKISQEKTNGLRVIEAEDSEKGAFVQEWVHDIVEFAGDTENSLPYSVGAVDAAIAAGGEPVQIESVEPLVAIYTNESAGEVLVKFDVSWGGTIIRATDSAQRIEVNHVATMTFGALHDIASSSSFGKLVNNNETGAADSIELNFPRSFSSYVHTLPPGATAQVTCYNSVRALGQPRLVPDTETGEREANTWGVAWGQPKIVVTALSKAIKAEAS